MRMMSENFSKCPKGLSQNLTIGLNLKFPAKTLHVMALTPYHPLGDRPMLTQNDISTTKQDKTPNVMAFTPYHPLKDCPL
jgi:hypothetical protein